MERRPNENSWLDRPMSIYELHLGSWARGSDGERFLSYRELAEKLVPYVRDTGFTHIELLPVMEHPFAGSWGYQVVGFFAPTSRMGTPEDFKFFVDACHRAGIGVLLDWVPGHFPKDAYALAQFDGTALYEHADPRRGEHQDWGTLIFNYGRNEVRSFLLSNALFWLEQFHIDGLRVDAVASMLYLDYSRSAGEWLANKYGGRENLEAIDFLRQLNTLTHAEQPGTITAAEESTAWPGVSRPVHLGGLGFTYKWNMGWMHDMLAYMGHDPVHRRWAHNQITFSMLYAYHENFILPFSHDEVVHGKGSMIGKMPGDSWQKAANLRLLYGYMFGHPGKKLLFMGGEIAQWSEWNHDRGLEWLFAEEAPHRGMRVLVADLNAIYRREASMHQMDFDPAGFQWIDCNDNENSVVSFMRRARDPRDFTVFVLNFTPMPTRELRGGRARARHVPRAVEHRRRGVRRIEHGQRRPRRFRAGAVPGPAPPPVPHAPAVVVPGLEVGVVARNFSSVFAAAIESRSRLSSSAAPSINPAMRTVSPLRDRLRPGIRALFVGINPGMRSAATGHHFAGHSNRFWKLLFESGLVSEPLTYEDDWRLPEFGYGMTNLVARATPGIGDLTAADYAAGRSRLLAKIGRYRPEVVVLIGVTLYRALVGKQRDADGESGGHRILSGTSPLPKPLGLREERLAGARAFVLPNPSGRNANYSYADMLQAFRALRRFLEQSQE